MWRGGQTDGVGVRQPTDLFPLVRETPEAVAADRPVSLLDLPLLPPNLVLARATSTKNKKRIIRKKKKQSIKATGKGYAPGMYVTLSYDTI